jgi:hypothetical protein
MQRHMDLSAWTRPSMLGRADGCVPRTALPIIGPHLERANAPSAISDRDQQPNRSSERPPALVPLRHHSQPRYGGAGLRAKLVDQAPGERCTTRTRKGAVLAAEDLRIAQPSMAQGLAMCGSQWEAPKDGLIDTIERGTVGAWRWRRRQRAVRWQRRVAGIQIRYMPAPVLIRRQTAQAPSALRAHQSGLPQMEQG